MTLYKNIRGGCPENASPCFIEDSRKSFEKKSHLIQFTKAQKELSVDSRKSFSSPQKVTHFLNNPTAHENWYNISSSTLMISFFLSFLNLTKKNTSLR